jgi:hypothetical protein
MSSVVWRFLGSYESLKTIIAIRDLRQVAPVVPNGSPAEVLLASIKSSNLWQEFEVFTLKQPMRYESDPELCDFVFKKNW